MRYSWVVMSAWIFVATARVLRPTFPSWDNYNGNFSFENPGSMASISAMHSKHSRKHSSTTPFLVELTTPESTHRTKHSGKHSSATSTTESSTTPKTWHSTTIVTTMEGPALTPVSDCVFNEDPDNNGPNGCSCDGYTGLLPTLTGDSSCGYSTITGSATAPTPTTITPAQGTGAVSGFPFTTSEPNGAVVAYQLSSRSDDIGYLTGSSTTVTEGTSLSLVQDPTASVNAGTLNGDALYTSVSNSIAAACPTPTGLVGSCAQVSPIPNIAYLDIRENLQYNANMQLDLPLVNYTSVVARAFMIQSIATLFNATTLNASNANVVTPKDPNAGNPDGFTTTNDPSVTFYNAPAMILAEFYDAGNESPAQRMMLQAALDIPSQKMSPGGAFACAMGELATDGLAMLAFVPGLQWMGPFSLMAGRGVTALCASLNSPS